MGKLKKRKDGYYCAWYKGKQFLGKTAAEAEQKRDEYKYECEHGIERPEQITVFDLADEWLPTKAGIDKRTYNQYVTVMEKMTDLIGNKLVSAVTPADIKKVWKEFDGLSQSYINKGKFLYKSFFQYAIDNRYCISNPMLAESAKPHKGTKGTHRCLTKTEQNLVETVPHRAHNAAMFMMKAGLRRSEVLALQKADIHDDRIWVTKAVKFINNRPVIGDTKNESSERSVPLFASLKPLVDDVKNYILPDEDGLICSETAFNRAWESYMTDLSTHLNGCHKRWWHLTREWKQTHPKEYQHYLDLKEQNKKEEAEQFRLQGWVDVSFKPHDLRHTFVTTCRDKGIDIKVCINWCGHASERMILEIYDHPSADREKDAIKKMDNRKTITLKKLNSKRLVKSTSPRLNQS